MNLSQNVLELYSPETQVSSQRVSRLRIAARTAKTFNEVTLYELLILLANQSPQNKAKLSPILGSVKIKINGVRTPDHEA
jgi:hypothetical protein